MGRYLSRYKQGEHEQVWDDLIALGAAVRKDPVYADALAVAQETMRRVRDNIELLIPRLAARGYAFGYGWLQPPCNVERFTAGIRDDFQREVELAKQEPPLYTPPSAQVVGRVAELERRVGTLPLSLRIFYEVVGGVNFVGYHRDWVGGTPMGLDPLHVRQIETALQEVLEEDEEEDEEDADRTARYRIMIAPDYDGKYFISGSGTYDLKAPSLAADAPLEGEWHQTTFFAYLRHCFRWAGLTGLEHSKNPPRQDIAKMVEGLHAF
jgi:hypothetical protein